MGGRGVAKWAGGWPVRRHFSSSTHFTSAQAADRRRLPWHTSIAAAWAVPLASSTNSTNKNQMKSSAMAGVGCHPREAEPTRSGKAVWNTLTHVALIARSCLRPMRRPRLAAIPAIASQPHRLPPGLPPPQGLRGRLRLRRLRFGRLEGLRRPPQRRPERMLC